MNNHLSDDPNYKLWVLLHQTRDVLHKVREKEVAKHGVTAVQSAVLFIISANGGEDVTTATISNWLLREPHTISTTLTRMAKQGLIEKITNRDRGGELTVRLTKKGQDIYNKTTNIDIINEMLADISEEERELLRSLLTKVRSQGLKQLFSVKNTVYP